LGNPLSMDFSSRPDNTAKPTGEGTDAIQCAQSRIALIAQTPKPPYYAVIFTSIRSSNDNNDNEATTKHAQDYSATADRMVALAAQAEGFLGVESARNEVGITVSYWSDLDAIKKWKNHTEHIIAQEKGKQGWYSAYTTRICRVERDYSL